ncbi:DEAD/DEAH box helicase family protein [Candidatus Dojkabacteria bacterium]|uniref:DEAD/DEAH box helicase family protein n=1 Tax=Candidatus Dojkabacteria bacterium TaxID=2099670 RepID=A0A955L0I3_9BACT|nr:DEAD/DEAH box helicase family protein [Candidatus Dojkabacteria bacterium]
MTPEEKSRINIDKLLNLAGWIVQDVDRANLGAGLGIAVREFQTSSGPADYILFVNRKPVGVVEAKPEGFTLTGVEGQTERYAESLANSIFKIRERLPFNYESTGIETQFRDLRDPEPRARNIFAFHRPETLQEWLEQPETLRKRLTEFPELSLEGLRLCQFDAITNLEKSFNQDKPRALIQMATGSGKTYMAVSEVYRLLKFAKAKRVLFLVDRGNLGKQTNREFQEFITPDDGRKFTELYNVQHLKANKLDSVNKVTITTIQRLYSMLKGDAELDPDFEEESGFEGDLEINPGILEYNPNFPIETYDFIITDEAHRSIYNLWRQVLEYFDAYIIGLTATPSKQTFGFFRQNLVMEYSHERAVADGVNVPYDVYKIETKIGTEGSRVDAGFFVDKRDRDTRKVRWEKLDEDLEYDSTQLDKDVVSIDQIRTVVRTYKEKLPEIFPGRTEVPKTLIFAKTDSHAEDIVKIVREEFGKGSDFCKKITYNTTGDKPEDLIKSFRNSYNPRVAVTVDMISTGTDIKPLEVLIFMRDVKSRVYFEQMIGRGTRTIKETDLKTVTPDANYKDHFVIFDAVGVMETAKIDSRPLEKKPGISFKQLMNNVAFGNHDKDTLLSLANRLARFDRSIDDAQREEINRSIGGNSIKNIINKLFDAVDPDKIEQKARILSGNNEISEAEIEKAQKELSVEATLPFDNPDFRNTILDIKQRNEQTIDTVSVDEVTSFTGVSGDSVRAQKIVTDFKQFIEDNKDEITALEIIYNQPYRKQHLMYEQIRELAEKMSRNGLNSTIVWKAYAELERSKVKGEASDKLLTNIISLVRFAIGRQKELAPFEQTVDENFDNWLENQKKKGVVYTENQIRWLDMIKQHIAYSASIEKDDFDDTPFNQYGGLFKAYEVFGEKLEPVLEELNYVLVESIV